MKKNERISDFVARMSHEQEFVLEPCYEGYFTCFNAQQYYEAHDVLEHLWLKTRDENYAFFKGLIQVAGAFVHLQKQFLHPEHPKHAPRLRPASRLFRLGMKNLQPFRPRHWHLDVDSVCKMCADLANAIEASDYQKNPWSPLHAPKLSLLPASE